MRKHNRNWLIGGIVAFWGVTAVVLIAVLSGKPSDGKGEDKKPATKGIDREKVLKHMTSESDTVILFDDQGSVVSTDSEFLNALKPNARVIVENAKSHTKNLKGTVYATWSASGIGKRYTAKEAESILDDCIKLSTKEPMPSPKFISPKK